jgi:hypothetical protein
MILLFWKLHFQVKNKGLFVLLNLKNQTFKNH